jgi:hypothetical protein
MTHSLAGLAAGTTTTYTTANATVNSILGKMYSVAAQTNTATPTTDAVTGSAFTALQIGEACVFVYGFNAAGSAVVAQGAVVEVNDDGSFIQLPDYPPIPSDFAPFAYDVVRVLSTGSAWTFGASNQSSVTGVEHLRVDVSTLPDRPNVTGTFV